MVRLSYFRGQDLGLGFFVLQNRRVGLFMVQDRDVGAVVVQRRVRIRRQVKFTKSDHLITNTAIVLLRWQYRWWLVQSLQWLRAELIPIIVNVMILHKSVPVSLDLKQRLFGFHQSFHPLSYLKWLLLDVIQCQALLQLVALTVACTFWGTLSRLLWSALGVALQSRSLTGVVNLLWDEDWFIIILDWLVVDLMRWNQEILTVDSILLSDEVVSPIFSLYVTFLGQNTWPIFRLTTIKRGKRCLN